MIQSDEQIMAAVARGDRDAFTVLCSRYSPRLFGLIVKILGFGAESEDLLQDVLLEIWRRAAQFNPDAGSVETWALMLARSRSIDRLRSRRSEQARLRKVAEQIPEHAEAPADPPAELADLFHTLTDEQKSVLTLAYQHGLSREQIAYTLQIPVGTVKTRLRSAIRVLGDALAPSEGHRP